MRIVAVDTDASARIEQMAQLLVDGFHQTAPDAWTNLDAGLQTVRQVLSEGFARCAVDDLETVLGWIGGLRQYDGYVWELHPLVVRPDCQNEGIGQALVRDFEEQVRVRGGLTILLGSDDEANLTTLSAVDLYDNLPDKLAHARGSRPHPLEFYRRLGYIIVGVVPDANGYGKPDILLAKRL